jgi:predicted membrane channel-forming protein YqfA (hemolysin III family)
MTEFKIETFMYEELPAQWPTNQYTLTGYRANIPFRTAALSILCTKHNEFWSIWTSIVPLAVLVYLMLADASSHPIAVSGVFIACITCQLCSVIYHTFHCVSLRATKALYNLDLAGVCCMAFGSPWLYMNAYGTSGLTIYMSTLFSLMIVCLMMLARATIRDEIAACEHWIIALSSLGNYPALHRPITTLATAAAFVGYLLFYRLHFPERFMRPGAADGKIWSSHVLWHCAVFASQLCFVMSTKSTPI